MKSKTIALMILVGTFAAICFLTGCATQRVPATVAPAPSVSTAALGQSITAASAAATSARQRTQTVIQTVDRIIAKTAPANVAELQGVKLELSAVSSDLQTTKDSLTRAEDARAQAQQAADALRTWGEAQQSEAVANAEGWQKEALQSSARERHVLKLQSLIGIVCGIAAGIIGLRFFGPYGLFAGPVVWLLTYFLT